MPIKSRLIDIDLNSHTDGVLDMINRSSEINNALEHARNCVLRGENEQAENAIRKISVMWVFLIKQQQDIIDNYHDDLVSAMLICHEQLEQLHKHGIVPINSADIKKSLN